MDPNEERRQYFKSLRKKQKKRRNERKREEERARKEQLRKNRFGELVESIRRNVAAGVEPTRPADLNIFDDGRSVMTEDKVKDVAGANCTATTAVQAREMSLRQKAAQTATTTQTERRHVSDTGLTEICEDNIVKLGKTIGSGTFGSCQLAKYRGSILVAVKEFKIRGDGEKKRERQKKEVIHEATVMSRLGDHPGLPLLFGVQTQTMPFRIVLQFHGDKKSSLTMWHAANKKALLSNDEWMKVISLVGDALQMVHSRGFLHNDLKANNVVLERRSYGFNPVIIDFGKSLSIDVAREQKKRKLLSKVEQKKYHEKYPHVAPEIVDGTGHQSIASDTYSFAKLVDFLCLKAGLSLSTAARVLAKNSALGPDPSKRPSLTELYQ
ncbi:hypothetical protein OS493_037683 [Desmophyllum pertusum]|uniref:Protein kinase domain-containing protein n=1 Tax=Desmophyllum pertusum TaxID=174260 RepID=A0A9W9YUA2_9CNID|nr:hypothetical protein OS493_037683 [Desmophyllum pertusum]